MPNGHRQKDVSIAIIGGSGVQEIFEGDIETLRVRTPYGPPSGQIQLGAVGKKRVAFLPRHGKGHIIPPHRVNYRANIWALKELGIERIIGVSAVGSLKEDYKPGEIAVPDQYIDFTKKREYTFYEGPDVAHVSLADPFCDTLRKVINDELKIRKIPHHEKGTYVCVEGPRFSTRAESRMFRNFADIIGMTLVPECQLAREKEICYGTLAMVTDYDVWAEKPVSSKEVIETMGRNVGNVKKVLIEILQKIPEQRSCECAKALGAAGV